METFATVQGGIVAAEDGLLFAEGARVGAHVEIEDRARRDEGFVGETDEIGVKLGIRPQRGVISRFGERDATRGVQSRGGFAGEVDDAEMREAVFALDQYKMRAKGGDAGKHDARAVGDDLVPTQAAGVDCRCGHEPKGPAVIIGANEEDAAGRVACAAGMVL